jgi:hypothetical protein
VMQNRSVSIDILIQIFVFQIIKRKDNFLYLH